MILLRRILPFFSSLSSAVLLSMLILDPVQWRNLIALLAVIVILSIMLMTQWHILSADFWAILFPLVGLFTGGVGILFFADIPQLQWMIALVLTLLCALYMENVFVFYYQPQKYTVLSLPNLSFFLNVFAVFGLFSFGYALDLINVLPGWHIVLYGGIYAFFFFLHLLWSYKLLQKKHITILFILPVLMIELIWALQFWPVAFYITGVVIAVIFFLTGSFVQLGLRQVLAKKMIFQYTAMSIVSIIAVLATTRWFM